MPEPFTMAITGYVVANAPHWLTDLRDTVLSKGKEVATEKGQAWLSDKEQQRHLEQVLKRAVQGGLKKFRQRKDRDQYKAILTNLFEPGEHSAALRREAMTLFALSNKPDLVELNDIYNRSLRIRNLSQEAPPAPVDAAPYLTSFFDTLISELYADTCFKSQISDVIRARAAMLMPQQLAETNNTLHQIHETLKNDYTEEQFQQDLTKYIDHMECVLRNLKIVGFLPKEQKRDPDIHGIFVPLRIALNDRSTGNEQQAASIVGLLERYPHMVLLGDPGSGKSTAIHHLAWSHAKANQSVDELEDVSLLPGYPLPLRIELRLLMQDRKHNPDYSFLSYATEVLLGRNHIHINLLMFERLLQRKRLFVLFDGLDEVTTLGERKRLVEEIEHFTQHYPGNHILVTSRPIGYKLASCSQHLFTHTKVQNFDDDQIRQFLERWYTHVLGLSPLQYEDQQELETLFKTLKGNQRLHKLAENPLLLTVITGLYRSQRLPEKRVQVYDRCAELLLETWAKLKGTDRRWRDMRLDKDDQSACVAHLGFQLHKRSQEESNTQKNDRSGTDTATDVPERVMLREIEYFISDQKLITEIAEQHKEARRFLDLMRIEAGLIVERGTDESEEKIYGFVHRTFQEYFAAVDVYKRSIENEEPALLKNFLEDHLHDPHWSEVILLLLGKLGRKPVTLRLHQILEGKINSRRSRYTDILEQDLFFVCDCLAEDMPVETDLATIVISSLSRLITTTPFSSQYEEALKKFAKLIRTRQFADLARKDLVRLATLSSITDSALKIEIAETLYKTSPMNSEEKQLGAQLLLQLAQCLDLSIEGRIKAAKKLYHYGPNILEEEQQAIQLLLQLAQCPDLSVADRIKATEALLHYHEFNRSSEEQQAIQLLLQLAQCPDLSVADRIKAANAILYHYNFNRSENRKPIFKLLLQILQLSSLSTDHIVQIVLILYQFTYPNDQHLWQPSEVVLQLLKRRDPPFECIVLLSHISHILRLSQDNVHQITKNLLQFIERSDLSTEHTIQAANALYRFSYKNSEERRQAFQILLQFIERSDLSTEHTIQAANALYRSSPDDSDEQKLATHTLFRIAQCLDLSIEYAVQAIEVLYSSSAFNSKEREQAKLLLWQIAQNGSLTVDQRLRAVAIPITQWNASFNDKAQAIKELQLILSPQETTSYIEKKWHMHDFEVQPDEISYIVEMARQQLLPPLIRNQMYYLLQRSVSQFHKISDINTSSF